MKSRFIISTLLVGGLVMMGGRCSSEPAANNTQDTTTTTNTSTPTSNTDDGIDRQHGVIGTFPSDVLPLLEKVEVFDSIRNTSDPKVTVHEIEYASNTGVAEVYAKFNTQLTGDGWAEQNPQTQTVGTLQIMTGTFVKGEDTISVAVQTAVGEEKLVGSTKVKLKIEQAQ